ncbi:hypothetical protein [Nonomuraea sp. NPDC001023]|uniref:hypothetical protein n=1 Tax=unclassified Nonomuraea TaxID=2593643 RepID=UPI0033269CFE
MRRILLSIGLAGAVLFSGLPAGADAAPYIDYAPVKPPDNFIELRGAREQFRVPPLLVKACGDLPDNYGEDYPAHVLAQVTLLRMLDTNIGTGSIQRVMNGGDNGKPEPDRVVYPPLSSPANAAQCLRDLAPDWAEKWEGGPTTRRDAPGWKTVDDELSRVFELWGRPGTEMQELCHDGDWDLTISLVIRTWLLARYHYSEQDRARLDEKMSRVVWLQGGASQYDTVNCEIAGKDIPETENHNLLITSTRYLHNLWLPMLSPVTVQGATNKSVADYDVNFNPDNETNGLRARLTEQLDTWLRTDFLEYNSRIYARLDMIGLLNLYDLGDEALRPRVRAVLDLIAAKAATESMGELRNPTFRRRLENRGELLFDVDEVSPMMQVWVGDLAPVTRTGANFAEEGTLAASSKYRPPDALADLMLNPAHHSYLQAFNGRGQGELAFGAPGLTISGGGRSTPCAYGAIAGICFGSGNDPGHPERLLLIPRRVRGGQPDAKPVESWLLRSDYDGDTDCLGNGIACANKWVLGSYAPAASCRRAFDSRGDHVTALLFNRSCMDETWPRESCFYVYVRDLKAGSQTRPLSYLVVHTCEAGFDDFVAYMTDGPGQHGPWQNACAREHGKHPGGNCLGWKVSLTPPRVTGPLSPGDPVTLTARTSPGNLPYTISTTPVREASASGDVAAYANDRLRLANPAAGERLYDGPGGTSPESDRRGFTAVGNVTLAGEVSVALTGVTHPDLVRDVQSSYVDQTVVEQECTLTRPDGTRYCDETHGPPMLPLASWTYYYRGTPFESGQPVTYTEQRPIVHPDHTYLIRTCLTWWRFMTAQDYWSNQYGEKDPATEETCVNNLVSPR